MSILVIPAKFTLNMTDAVTYFKQQTDMHKYVKLSFYF